MLPSSSGRENVAKMLLEFLKTDPTSKPWFAKTNGGEDGAEKPIGAPLRPSGAWTISAGEGGGSDHLWFDQVGLPGLFFIQDDMSYESISHSSADVMERAQVDDLKQAAVVMAAFVYNTAMRDERLPRRTVGIPVE